MALDGTYTGLIASIASWLDRRDMTAVIPDLVQLSEKRLDTMLRVREMTVRDLVEHADEAYENLPADYLELKSIRFNTTPTQRPEYATLQRIEDMRALYGARGGVPRYYSIANNQIIFETAPTGGPELEIFSYVRIPKLNTMVDVNGTPTLVTGNAILTTYPNLYLFGALSEAAPFLNDDPRIATWEAKFGSFLDMAHAADKASEEGPGPLIQRPRTVYS